MTDQRPDENSRPETDPFASPTGANEAEPAAAPAAGYAAPPSAQPAPTRAAVAGWYTDPWDATKHRYWDGGQWTAGQAPAQAPVHAPAPAKSRGLSGKAIAGIVAGVTVLVVGAIAAVAIFLPRLEDATMAALNSEPTGRPLESSDRSGWSATPAMGGTATFKYDPAWEDASDYVDGQAMEATMQAEGGVDATFDGAWLVAGDMEADSTVVIAVSVEDVGGSSSARLEATGFITNLTFGVEGTDTTAEGPVLTSGGYEGYVAEYEFPLYGETWPNSVGVVVEGNSQLLVYSLGSASTGSGIEAVESVLDSLEVN